MVLGGKATAAKKKSVLALVEKMITMFKGKVVEVDEWGVKDMAYEIEGNATGLYVVLTVEIAPDSVRSLQEKLRLEDGIIRYLVVRK